MAVLVEGISVVIKATAIASKYQGGWVSFKEAVPNITLCADGEIVRVGFMSPVDVESFVGKMERYGLNYLKEGKAEDLVVVDQIKGPMVACDWIEFGKIGWEGDPNKRVSACNLVNSKIDQILTPDGWKYDRSLSKHFGFVSTVNKNERLVPIENKNGCDVYLDLSHGKEVFIGRTKISKSNSDYLANTVFKMTGGPEIQKDQLDDVIVPADIRLPDLISWMEIHLKSPVRIKTLRGRSVFTAWFDRSNSSLVITTSSGKTHKPLAFDSIDKIFQRYIQAPPDKRHMPSYYEIQTWQDAPDKIRPPYVVAIIRNFSAGIRP
jgi:hypothetical protein